MLCLAQLSTAKASPAIGRIEALDGKLSNSVALSVCGSTAIADQESVINVSIANNQARSAERRGNQASCSSAFEALKPQKRRRTAEGFVYNL